MHFIAFFLQSFACLFCFLSDVLLDITPCITELFGRCIICTLSTLFGILPTLSYILFCLFQDGAFVTCCFFGTFLRIFSSLLEMLLGIFGFAFSISSCYLLDLLLCLLTQWLFYSSSLFKALFCIFCTLLEILLCLFSFTLCVSSNNLTNFLSSFVVDILSSFFQVFPTFNSSLFDILISCFFGLHASCLLSFILSFLYFLSNVSFNFLSSFFDVSSSFFEVLFGFFGFLFSIRSCHFMDFFGCCLVQISRNLFDLLPALGYGGCYIFQNSRLLVNIFSQLLQLLFAFLPLFLSSLLKFSCALLKIFLLLFDLFAKIFSGRGASLKPC